MVKIKMGTRAYNILAASGVSNVYDPRSILKRMIEAFKENGAELVIEIEK